ncbi:MAG TPA: NUMOD4 domain-containing protein [Mycobacterium sp.]|uniref:NUMOD4 domain-containing protein n=1 Tax=Mycobacterium sp. TaxID=1785 RepID=UPI002D48F40C|nr:NUMOD4 domain-containing protein [Mycobacterium sp.]HZU46173.1 NUMOD4 domain-containing protein [Mycobacterium sp.]
MTVERWAPVPNFPGYLVSDRGRVRGLPRIIWRSNGVPISVPGRMLVVHYRKYDGKPVVHLSTGRARQGRTCYVEALLVQAFGNEVAA